MFVLRESLINCGYQGACVDELILAWAIRTGACSEFFRELITWLEEQLSNARVTTLVRSNIRNLFAHMRSSILMRPHVAAAETVLNPREYRLQTLKVLVHQLELSQRTEMPAAFSGHESPARGQQQLQYTGYNDHLRVTLNTEHISCGRGWNKRLVRYNPNLLEMYE